MILHSKQKEKLYLFKDIVLNNDIEVIIMSNQTLTFTSSELFLIQEMMREAQANPFHSGDYQDEKTEKLIEQIIDALNESYN